MSPPKSKAPAESQAAYDRLVAAHPLAERKGATMPYTSVNGHMFSFLDGEGVMGLRLPKEEKSAFEEKFKSKPMEQYGRIMKEYVTVPDGLLQDTERLLPYFHKSYDYTKSLPPKATKK